MRLHDTRLTRNATNLVSMFVFLLVVTADAAAQDRVCNQCFGSHKCRHCDSGRVRCSGCGGTGKSTSTPYLSVDVVDCRSCNGTGSKGCASCSGSGDCRACSGLAGAGRRSSAAAGPGVRLSPQQQEFLWRLRMEQERQRQLAERRWARIEWFRERERREADERREIYREMAARADAFRRTDDPELRAQRYLETGQRQESHGDRQAAVSMYRLLLSSLPSTAAATHAQSALARLTGSR